MRAVSVIAVILIVALVTMSEAKPFGQNERGNRKGHRDHDSNRPDCQLRCPRPTRRSRVCASVDGLRNHTFPSACLADRIACTTKRNLTVVAEGACPKTRAAAVRIGKEKREEGSESKEGESKEGESEEENNSNETTEDTVTVTTPATSPSSEPSTSVASDRMTSGSTSATSASDGPASNPSISPVTSTSGSPAVTEVSSASPGPAVPGPASPSPVVSMLL